MFEIRCIFCYNIHRSEYFDVIEEGILACRDKASRYKLGLLDDYQDSRIPPVSPEMELIVREAR